jgi:hypothetical protein
MPPDEPVILTREKLYEEVWSEPISKLAPKYGLSDVGFAKICRRLRVPVPGRGYWRQKEVGQRIRRPSLPKLSATATPSMREVRLRKNASGLASPESPQPVVDQERFEALDENRIVVPDILKDPHPLVAGSVAALRRAKPDHQGYLVPKTRSCLGVRVTLDSIDRAMCIYDALLKALDARGYQVSTSPADEPGTMVRFGEEDVAILIEEKVEQLMREGSSPTRRPHRFSYGSEIDWTATGQLTVRIDHSFLDGVRCSWKDGKRQRVEECLNSFVLGLVRAAETLKERRLAREAWEREWREAEERRAEEAHRKEAEAARIRALDSALASWQRSRLVRE